MMLAEPVTCPSGIEIAKGNKLQSVQFVIPMEHALEHELGFAVWIDGALRYVFGHGDTIRGAIGRAGGTKNELFNAGSHGSVEQTKAIADVVAKILARVGHGFADEGVGGEVKNGLGFCLLNGTVDVAFLFGL